MFPYFMLFSIPLAGLFYRGRATPGLSLAFWIITGCVLAGIIGLRHQVGGDWYSYIAHFDRTAFLSLLQVLQGGDPGYYFVNWIVFKSGGTIYLVNLFCAVIFVFGLIAFCRRQPLPWLALAVAIPYLVIVVAMGYTRQSVALGFLLLALTALSREKMLFFVALVVLGALFHKSVIVMLPVAALSASTHRVWNIFWMGIISILGAYLFVFDSVDKLWASYVVAEYESQGGLIRTLMNLFPALLYLVFYKKLCVGSADKRLWFWISLLAIICVPLVLVSSTATDRLALYLIPLQIYVFSRLHLVVSDAYLKAIIVLGVLVYYFAVQCVWLLYAANSHQWLPYQMYPFAS